MTSSAYPQRLGRSNGTQSEQGNWAFRQMNHGQGKGLLKTLADDNDVREGRSFGFFHQVLQQDRAFARKYGRVVKDAL